MLASSVFRRAFAAVLAACCFLFLPASGWSLPGAQAATGVRQESAPGGPVVRLNVLVTDAAGQPVRGLSARDFTILDNKQSARIVNFEPAKADAANFTQAIVILDEVNSGFRSASEARIELDKFLRSSGAGLPLPLTIGLLTDTDLKISGAPSQDGAMLAKNLDHVAGGLRSIGRASAFYGAQERTDVSLHALEAILSSATAQPGRKLLLWISPGWPYLAYPGTDYSNQSMHTIYGHVGSLWSAFEQSDTVLYAIDPIGVDDSFSFQDLYYKSALKPAVKWEQASLSNLGLQVLAIQNGGLVLNSTNDVSHEIARCMQDATAFYTIVVPRAVSEEPGVFHALSVQVDRPGLHARTAVGYYTR